MASSTPTQYSFLALPMELRLMVYQYLRIKTRHHKIDYTDTKPMSYTLITKSIPGLAILATSRQISVEARLIIEPRITELRREPLRIIGDPIVILYRGFIPIFRCLNGDAEDCELENYDETVMAVDGQQKCSHERFHAILKAASRGMDLKKRVFVIDFAMRLDPIPGDYEFPEGSPRKYARATVDRLVRAWDGLWPLYKPWRPQPRYEAEINVRMFASLAKLQQAINELPESSTHDLSYDNEDINVHITERIGPHEWDRHWEEGELV